MFPKGLEAQYLEALRCEIAGYEWQWRPETVYIGGGTPSLMDIGELRSILDAIPGRAWNEATIEAAPGTLTGEKICGWRDAGINRVSLGVQSFVAREIARTGRKHSAEIVEREAALLRDLGIENINIDLIAGLPGQRAESWRESLDWIGRQEPPHV